MELLANREKCSDIQAEGGVRPSLDAWSRDASLDTGAEQCGMYLFHRGVVRRTSRAQAREGVETAPVAAMHFSYHPKRAAEAVSQAAALPGIYYVRAWLNEGMLSVGDDIMLVLVGGDTRPHVVSALQALVEKLKTVCVTEQEIFEADSSRTV